MTLAFGVGMGVSSVIVMLLYIRLEAAQSGLYSAPGWLIVAPLGVLCWMMRIWVLSHRGELDDDPIDFALRDRVSWGFALAIIIATMLAT